MTSESTPSPQGASQGTSEGITLPTTVSPSQGLVEHLMHLAQEMGHWHHLIFNAAHHPNRTGLTNTADEIRTASYELYILCGMTVIQAKLKAGISLTELEQQQLDDQLEDSRRKESVRRHQDGLHGVPVPTVEISQGRFKREVTEA